MLSERRSNPGQSTVFPSHHREGIHGGEIDLLGNGDRTLGLVCSVTRRRIMSIVSRIAVTVAVAAAVSSSAFAQSSMQNHGTGIHHGLHHKMPHRQGLSAFDLVPSFQDPAAFDPALSGGGSVGYNENLRKDQW
jgi:hypothetical protein